MIRKALLVLALLVTSADAKPVRIGTYRPVFRIGSYYTVTQKSRKSNAPVTPKVTPRRVIYYQTRPLVITRPLQSYPTFSGSS